MLLPVGDGISFGDGFGAGVLDGAMQIARGHDVDDYLEILVMELFDCGCRVGKDLVVGT